jgi:hypothetical protein
MDLETLYAQVIATTNQVAPNLEYENEQRRREIRKELYFLHIENTLRYLTDEIASRSFHLEVMEAAKQGMNRALIYEVQGYYGDHKTVITKEDVEYETMSLPVQFIAKGPRQSPQNRLYGIKFFTANGIEPLAQRLQLRFNPFQVSIQCVKNIMQVWVQWNPKPEVYLEEAELDIEL